MASLLSSSLLRSGPKLGSATPSSLVRSAATLTNQINSYNDAIQAYQFSNNPSDTQFQQYSSYLQNRINQLNSTGSITNLTKAISMSRKLESATHTNMSFNIKNATIAVMTGTGTDQQKLDYITQAYSQASSIGDVALATTLESQAYSLQQSIQLAQQTAATNAKTLTDASGANQASVATQIDGQLKQLNADVGASGIGKFNSAISSWVAQKKSKLQALANGASDSATAAAITKVINTSQPSYWDVVNGLVAAQVTAHQLSSQIYSTYDPAKANSEAVLANNIMNGSTKISTLGGSLTLQEIQTAQANPQAAVPSVDAATGTLRFAFGNQTQPSAFSAITGLKYNAQGNVVANFSGSDIAQKFTPAQETKMTADLKKAGFIFTAPSSSSTYKDGVPVETSANTPSWLAKSLGITPGTSVSLRVYPNTTAGGSTSYQIGSIGNNGNQIVGQLTSDNTGKMAFYTGSDVNGSLTYGKQIANGQYGFNQNQNGIVNNPITAQQNFNQHVSTILGVPATSSFANSPFLAGLGAQYGMPTNKGPQMTQRAGGGFNFVSANGMPISAFTYAQQTGQQFRTVLQNMANAGDQFSKQALNYAGNDGAYNPATVPLGVSNNWSSLTWGNPGIKLQETQAQRMNGGYSATTSSGTGAVGGGLNVGGIKL